MRTLHRDGYMLLLFLLLPACSLNPASQPQTLTVFAAASLTSPFEDLAQVFEDQHPEVKVSLVLAGSQQLATQLREGARADVFASANHAQMDEVVASGLTQPGSLRDFTSSQLVLVVPSDNPAGIQNVADLAQPGSRLVLAAVEVPVGQYSLELLAKASQVGELGADFQERVLSNVVSYENNVKTVLAKVILGEADAGIVYSSDVGADLLDRVSRIEIPDRWNVTAAYPIVRLSQSNLSELADAFIQLTLSEQGQQILSDHGFLPVAP